MRVPDRDETYGSLFLSRPLVHDLRDIPGSALFCFVQFCKAYLGSVGLVPSAHGVGVFHS